MINEKAQEHILSAIEKEKEAAISNHGYFHSDHEFWAVLKEEVEELQEEDCGHMGFRVKLLWERVKSNKVLNQNDLNFIKESAINAICEAVQVVAVIDKYLEGESKKVKCEKCGGGMDTVFSQKNGVYTIGAICPYCGHYAVLNKRSEDEIMQMEE